MTEPERKYVVLIDKRKYAVGPFRSRDDGRAYLASGAENSRHGQVIELVTPARGWREKSGATK